LEILRQATHCDVAGQYFETTMIPAKQKTAVGRDPMFGVNAVYNSNRGLLLRFGVKWPAERLVAVRWDRKIQAAKQQFLVMPVSISTP